MTQRKIYTPIMNYDDEMRTHVPSCTVLESESATYFSGLYDSDGNRLMVTLKTEPIGFVHVREEV